MRGAEFDDPAERDDKVCDEVSDKVSDKAWTPLRVLIMTETKGA